MTTTSTTATLDPPEVPCEQEETAEAERSLLGSPRPMRIQLPPGGVLPTSTRWLHRFYGSDRMVREKKPGVFDHLRSYGPYMASLDQPSLVVLDGMSQTATMPLGFAADRVVRAYVEGEFGDTLLQCPDTTAVGHPELDAFAQTMRSLVPGLFEVSLVNSGAESCEKAFALCLGSARARNPKATRLLVFEGSFHGRTLLALHASHSPSKRTPYEFEGHEVCFAPFPNWTAPNSGDPVEPEGFLHAVAQGDFDALRSDAGADPLLRAELDSLEFLHRALLTNTYAAVAIEPMQSEGGDRYASPRFFRALRVLTRVHHTSLIFDEVQTGFGLGGTFAWHHQYGLVDLDGRPDVPDCVTFAKRAQVGVVLSRFADPEPTSVHLASLVRGRLHAEVLAGDDYARSIEAWVNTRLDSLAQRFAELVHNPRCRGYAFAFDMPSAEMLSIYLAQRFYRGAIVFGSGTKTVRYRLNRSFALAHVERLFEAITHTLEWMQQHQGPAPAWEDDSRIPSTERAGSVCDSVTVRVATPDEAEALLDAIMALEAKVYEAARRDARTKLQMAFEEGGVAVVAEVKTESGMRLVGSALGAPLERIKNLDGCVDDPYYGAEHTLYSLALTVDPEFRGLGLGYKLKSAQLRAAASIRREDASPRYRHATARNRVGATDAMMRISERLGGYEVFRLESQYEAQAAARYYRMPLGAFQVDPPPGKSIPKAPSPDYDLASLQPLSSVPASLTALHERGGLFGPAVNKITLCNYITPAVARAVECVESLMPALPHLYLASSRDEVFDKAVRLLRHHRAESQSVLGFSGGYFGHTTAAARALSDPDLHRQGPSYFRNFFRVPHPCDDEELSIQALMRRVDALGGAEKIVGLFFETLQERTGQTISDAFFLKLKRFRDETGIPLVAIETASSYYRSARGPFAVSSAPVIPDVVGWWSGAQSGFLHCSDDIFVTKPLTFVSTWDGDELSMIRCDHTLRHLRHVDLSAQVERFEQLLRRPAFVSSGFETRGLGLYRVFCMNEHAEGFTRHMRSRGFALRTVPGGAVPIALPLDFGDWDALESAFNESIAALNRTASKGARQ